ncbi:MCP methyltransferase, CheR-type [Sulfurimonas gotlandica GD1]|uniref:protein-glutamate O-methyltransferase n=1 Tax=Sulfurimonas gotlandica (strain DSM 19862 / JCM 16533 / GD1) TaxID=929558 RepID=B6BNV5_SULGG|nr:protein-glutamate O-methyltransferase CheR [Sulfurimonas gotlandica]EDZ61195.1 CheR methyltransferase, SAM binding domain [Sulfurimonas gotlandica GD1]EHP28909.1 MCP methyltransferase, CheR-type [Sulfurimonas gotlandica GD1]
MAYLLSKENFLKMSEFVYRKSGIYLEEEKHYEKLAKYIDSRASTLELDSFRKYFFKLRFEDKDGEEFQALMNGVTVNETYFYREKDQFEALVNKILPELHKTLPASKTLRILSSPCSTGEEPYSMVLHIVEEGKVIEERDIEIVGIDIDSTVIEKAKKAKYTERSVHAIPKGILSKWFNKKSLGYELGEDLQGSVDFQVANVFDKVQMRNLGKFDVIFSRNMLIYFDDASRKEVAMTFYDMLNPGGYVLLGHAEYMSRIVSVFTAKKIDNTLVYQK